MRVFLVSFLFVFPFVSIGCSTPIEVVLDPVQKEATGSFSYVSADGVQTFISQGSTLFHVSPEVQVGPRVALVVVDDGISVSQFVVGGEARYNLKTEGDFLPFVGGSLNFVKVTADDGLGSESETGFNYTLNVGGRTPLSPGAYLVTQLQYSNTDIANEEFDNFGVFAGYAVRY